MKEYVEWKKKNFRVKITDIQLYKHLIVAGSNWKKLREVFYRKAA